jgi:hypothetical protein
MRYTTRAVAAGSSPAVSCSSTGCPARVDAPTSAPRSGNGPSRADGAVTFRGKAWTPQGDGRYQATDGERLVFLTGTDGRRYVATDGSAAELMSRAETLPVNVGVLMIFCLPVLGTLAMPIAGLVRRIRRRPAATTRTWRLARRLAVTAALLGVLFLVGLIVTVAAQSGEFRYAVPWSFRILLGVPVAALATAVGAAGLTVIGWHGGAGVAARIHQVALLAGMVALTWFLWQWNLLGWQGM